jgi:transposase
MDDSRLLLSDRVWTQFAAAIAAIKSPAGAPPELSDRDFIEALLYRARTGCPWRDLPTRFGAWDAVYQRFRRWQKAGYFQALFQRLPPDLEAVTILFFDSTIIRAHGHAAGASAKKGGPPPKPSAAVGAASAPRSTSPSPTSKRRWSRS